MTENDVEEVMEHLVRVRELLAALLRLQLAREVGSDADQLEQAIRCAKETLER